MDGWTGVHTCSRCWRCASEPPAEPPVLLRPDAVAAPAAAAAAAEAAAAAASFDFFFFCFLLFFFANNLLAPSCWECLISCPPANNANLLCVQCIVTPLSQVLEKLVDLTALLLELHEMLAIKLLHFVVPVASRTLSCKKTNNTQQTNI